MTHRAWRTRIRTLCVCVGGVGWGGRVFSFIVPPLTLPTTNNTQILKAGQQFGTHRFTLLLPKSIPLDSFERVDSGSRGRREKKGVGGIA